MKKRKSAWQDSLINSLMPSKSFENFLVNTSMSSCLHVSSARRSANTAFLSGLDLSESQR